MFNKIVSLINVKKSYLKSSHSFYVKRGDTFLIVGKNGCGKTTIIKMICGLRRVSSGELVVNGNIAYCPDIFCLPKEETGKQYLTNLAHTRKVPFDSSLTSKFGIPLENKIKTYSKGNMQKLALIATLTAKTDIYIFDEPYNALDLHSKKLLSNELRKLKGFNKTIIISSHSQNCLKGLVDQIYEIH